MRALISYNGPRAFVYLLVHHLRIRGVQSTWDLDLAINRPDLPITVDARGRSEDIEVAVDEFRRALPQLPVHLEHLARSRDRT